MKNEKTTTIGSLKREIQKAEQLTQAAEAVLIRENVSRTYLSAITPIAILALAPSLLLIPMRSLCEPSLADHLEDAGMAPAHATRTMRSLGRPGPHQEQIALRLARAGADPDRLREMDVYEAAEYLATFLAKSALAKSALAKSI